MDDQIIVQSSKLVKFATEVFIRSGVSQKYANIIADALIQADLRGVSSHGVSRIPIYLKRIQLGLVSPDPTIKIVNKSHTTALLDGDYGMGQIVAYEAMTMAIQKARESNIGIIGVKKSHHFGASCYYTMMAVREGMIGFACSNTTPLMPVPGGAERIIGNNPLSFAIPAGKQPAVVLDMACSQVAQGKIMVARDKKEKIPEGWAVDINGKSTTDPAEALKGYLLPMGGPKGYGLAVIVDILSGVLTGASYGKNVTSIYNNLTDKQDSGHFMAAINVSGFMDIDSFKQRVDDLITEIKGSKQTDYTKEIFMPGEIEFRNAERNITDGISIPKATISELKEAAVKIGMDYATAVNMLEDGGNYEV